MTSNVRRGNANLSRYDLLSDLNPFKQARGQSTRRWAANLSGLSEQVIQQHETGLINAPNPRLVTALNISEEHYYRWRLKMRALASEWLPVYDWGNIAPEEYELLAREALSLRYELKAGRNTFVRHLVMHPRNWSLHLQKPAGYPPVGELAQALREAGAI